MNAGDGAQYLPEGEWSELHCNRRRNSFATLSFTAHLYMCINHGLCANFPSFLAQPKFRAFNPFTATGYFDIPPPRWPTFLAMLFQILKEGMGLSLLDELEVRYHVIKK